MFLLPRLAYPSRAGGGNERCGEGFGGGGGGGAPETAEAMHGGGGESAAAKTKQLR